MELEDWVYGTRDFIARRVQEALVRLAEQDAAKGLFAEAARRAEAAHELGSAIADPDLLQRLHTLLLACGSLRAGELREEAQGFDLPLAMSAEEARASLARTEEVRTRRGGVHLPIRSTTFVGRREELERLGQLLERDEYRLITVTGLGGSGKTRLALRLAQEQQELGAFPDGVFFVPLDSLSDASAIPNAIARNLGLELSSHLDAEEQVRTHLERKNLLLLLDNFEHLLGGATFVRDVLVGCPEVRVLVTSRERLDIGGEWVFQVRGLPLPDDDFGIESGPISDAVLLFQQRAMSADLEFVLTGDNLGDAVNICRLVEGSPLGIELAASWARVMPLGDIASELVQGMGLLRSTARDVPARHLSIDAAFEHSWRLLSPQEQVFQRRLSVFRGGFHREAAAAVAGATIPQLAGLVDKSLLRFREGGRYDLHPLVHQFTAEKLAAEPEEEAETQRLHARFYLRLAEEAEPHLIGPEAGAWLDRLEREHDNIRAALGWAQVEGEAEEGLRLATKVSRFWLARGHLREGSAWLTELLALPLALDQRRVRASALDVLGSILHHIGEWSRARKLLGESLAIWRELGEERKVAATLNHLGFALLQLSEAQAARALSEEALQLNRELRQLRGSERSVTNLGWIAMALGDFRDASYRFQESLELTRELGNPRGIGYACANLAWAKRYLGELDAALPLTDEALEVFESLGDEQMHGWACTVRCLILLDRGDLVSAEAGLERNIRYLRRIGGIYGLKMNLRYLADAVRALGDGERARRLLEEAVAISREKQDRSLLAEGLVRLAQLAIDAGDAERAGSLCREGLLLKRDVGDRHGLVEGLEATARLLAIGEEPLEALRLYSAASALRGEIEAPLPPIRQAEHEACLRELRTSLGEIVSEQTWSMGQVWTLEEAVEFALTRMKQGSGSPGR